MSFVHKVALVTGAAGAIGRAICEELLKSGVKRLAAVDLHSDKPQIVTDWTNKYRETTIKYFPVDVTSLEDLKQCYETFTESSESLDIVVNSAGIFNENDYRKVVDVNLSGIIGSSLLAIEHMRLDNGRGKGGIVLNVASVAGLSPFSSVPIYSTTKHGVIAFTRSVAHRRENLGVKLLTLCPGTTESRLLDRVSMPEYSFKLYQEPEIGGKTEYPPQNPSVVGKAAVKVMQEGKNGSVWIINSGKMYEKILPQVKF
ncbi:alcohol dehydrogenase 1-like [Phlebotomus argentipes]|uniref:alcohol dehydrogenase 1-like n=1 Tax=Phlebotomus argentipes TaxID=94469 RepID=UPI00289302BD|nr:alcohol dehydrogenase 1-like [Phlebotomus argentipes]